MQSSNEGPSEVWESVPMTGWTITHLGVDFTTLYLSVVGDPRAGEDGLVKFVAPVRIVDQDGVTLVNRDAGYAAGPQDLGPTLSIYGQTISKFEITIGGGLRLATQGGWGIDASSNPMFENWDILFPGGMQLISAPGGGVLRFDAQPGDRVVASSGPLKSFGRLLRPPS